MLKKFTYTYIFSCIKSNETLLFVCGYNNATGNQKGSDRQTEIQTNRIPKEITACSQDTAMAGKTVSLDLNGEVKHQATLSK